MRIEKTLIRAALIVAAMGAGQACAQQFREGEHYERLPAPQPTVTGPGRVEVAEIFRYDCVHCYAFEPHLERWRAGTPGHVELVRIPAAFNARERLHARAFYAAEALGVLEDAHTAFFEEIHVHGNLLDSDSDLAAFFERFGVDAESFGRVFDSFAVHAKAARAQELVRRYRVAATPSIVVNGKYLSRGSMAGSYETWLEIVDELASAERAAAGATSD